MHASAPESKSQQIGSWCAVARVPGDHEQLSDAAALLIAAGQLPATAREALVRRVATGLPIPSMPGGFAELRRLQRAIDTTASQLSGPVVPAMVATMLKARESALVRRRDDIYKAMMNGKVVFAGSIRGIRRERREGVYLEVAERDQLFKALLNTPTPNVMSGGYVKRAGSLAFDRVASAFGQIAAKAGSTKVERWVNEIVGEAADKSGLPTGDARFADGYETILFLVGEFYDRITGSPAWYSEHFEVQRTQINLHAEVAEISTDVLALRAVRIDLERARRNGGFDPAFAAHIATREQSLRPVWAQLINRARALAGIAEVMETAAVELRLLNEFAYTATIDDRIDSLIARSGDREISADNADRLREQIRAGEEQLRIYRDVLQGSLVSLGPVELMAPITNEHHELP